MAHRDINVLPEGFVEMFEEFLPDYSNNKDVALANDLSKFIAGEFDYQDPDDLRAIIDIKEEYPDPKKTLNRLNIQMYVQVLQAILEDDIQTNDLHA